MDSMNCLVSFISVWRIPNIINWYQLSIDNYPLSMLANLLAMKFSVFLYLRIPKSLLWWIGVLDIKLLNYKLLFHYIDYVIPLPAGFYSFCHFLSNLWTFGPLFLQIFFLCTFLSPFLLFITISLCWCMS